MLERPLFKQQMTSIVVGLDQVWYIKEHWLRFWKKKVAAQLRFAGLRNNLEYQRLNIAERVFSLAWF